MRFRRNPLPQRLVDFLCFFLTGILFPLGCLFEVTTILPNIHEPGSIPHTIAVMTGFFLFFNIMGNMIACMIIDTSVDPERIPKTPDGTVGHHEWIHCPLCDKLSPPKSWHCRLCGVCILNRDHHCLFTGCCIGHHNRRYFVCFLVYLFIAAIYGMTYNVIEIWLHRENFINNWAEQLASPFVLSVYQGILDVHSDNILLMALCLNIYLLLFTTVFLIYTVPKVLRGQVSAEFQKKFSSKEMSDNLRSVFGQRMYWAWLFPLFESQLPDDGYYWKDKSNDDYWNVNSNNNSMQDNRRNISRQANKFRI